MTTFDFLIILLLAIHPAVFIFGVLSVLLEDSKENKK